MRSPAFACRACPKTPGHTTGGASTCTSTTGASRCGQSAKDLVSSERPRVLVVDDSALMRRMTTQIIKASEEFTVAGTARNGYDALKQVHSLDPDIVTLD